MSQHRRCDNCNTTVAELWTVTDENTGWISAETRRLYGPAGGYQTSRLDFCSWDCMAAYAWLKVLEGASG